MYKLIHLSVIFFPIWKHDQSTFFSLYKFTGNHVTQNNKITKWKKKEQKINPPKWNRIEDRKNQKFIFNSLFRNVKASNDIPKKLVAAVHRTQEKKIKRKNIFCFPKNERIRAMT